MDSAASMMNRFLEASRRLGAPAAQNFDQDRIFRLREDIDAFRRDLKYLDAGGVIILAPDSAEIISYIGPEIALGHYCFPLEERAKFDIDFARAQGREDSFEKANATLKISRRLLRARAHLFNLPRDNIVLPPSLRELNVYLSMIFATRGDKDLEEVFKLIDDNVSKLKSDDPILQKLDSFSTLGKAEQTAVLGNIFDRVVGNPVIYADDLDLDLKDRRISKIVRANDFLLNSNSRGIEDFDWTKIIGKDLPALLSELRGIAPDKKLVQYLENLFFKLPSSHRTNLAIYADAQALAYVAAINDLLKKNAAQDVKIQFVSWALSPVRVARAYWPEGEVGKKEEALVEVRHPKLLAAAMDFSHINRPQLEADLDRFSQALNLYEVGSETKTPVATESLDRVRNAWAQLDNTLLAWATRIEGSPPSGELPLAHKRLEEIRQVVSEHREDFQAYLVERIDKLSRTLSDSHWAVVQPENVNDIEADCLFYEPKNCIVIRPQTDHSRFAIALYDTDLIRRIHADFEQKKAFGGTLIELTSTHKDHQPDRYREFRAEIQLLKAFLFAVRGDYVFAAQYCRLARSELAQSEITSNAHAEILYLAHYAHRELGKERGSEAEFNRCVRRLDDSQTAWDQNSSKHAKSLKSRYPISWITTCREIAVAEIREFPLSRRWKERIAVAYQSCLDQLAIDLSRSDEMNLRLDRYQASRAAQNVMFAYVFDAYDVGGWRSSFAEIIKPKIEHARSAWDVMRRIRESSQAGELLKNMARNELAYAVGSFLFGESQQQRDQAWDELRRLEAALERDPPMRRATTHLIRRIRREKS